jgi:hypothetical protein
MLTNMMSVNNDGGTRGFGGCHNTPKALFIYLLLFVVFLPKFHMAPKKKKKKNSFLLTQVTIRHHKKKKKNLVIASI